MDFWEFYQAINLHIHLKNLHQNVWAKNQESTVSKTITTMKSKSLNEKNEIFARR